MLTFQQRKSIVEYSKSKDLDDFYNTVIEEFPEISLSCINPGYLKVWELTVKIAERLNILNETRLPLNYSLSEEEISIAKDLYFNQGVKTVSRILKRVPDFTHKPSFGRSSRINQNTNQSIPEERREIKSCDKTSDFYKVLSQTKPQLPLSPEGVKVTKYDSQERKVS